MSRRRSRLEVMLGILSAVRDGIDKPTRIMYAINQSWTPTQRMLSNLVEQGIVELRIASGNGSSKKRYVITEKGVKVLDYFEKANEILPKDVYLTLGIPS